MPTILIVEDEAKMRRLLELNLGEDGFSTLSAGDAETGLKLLRENTVDLVVTDLKLPGMNGLEFLHAIKGQNAALPVVVMTAFGSVETAVEAMKAALAAANKTAAFKIYPGAPHGFHADYRPSYRQEAADDGWKMMTAWFKKYGVLS